MVEHTNNSFLITLKQILILIIHLSCNIKINYLYGLFDLEHYEKIIKPLIHKKLIIYCGSTILL